MTKSPRIIYLDFLKFIAIIAVIVIHLVTNDLYQGDTTTISWGTINIFSCLARFAVPVFLMVTGALLGDPAKPLPICKIYQKYLPRVIILYLVWDLLYAIFGQLGQIVFAGGTWDFATFGESLLSGHYHMWYLVALAGIYILLPLLRKITADKVASRYFTIIFLVVMTTSAVLHLFNLSPLSEVLSVSGLFSLLSYPAYFILGSYLHQTQLTKIQRTILYIAAGLVTAFSIILFFYYYNFGQPPVSYDYYVPLLSMALFVFAKQYFAASHRLPRLVQSVAEHTLGIYLVHVAVLDVIIALFHGLGQAWLVNLPLLPIFSIPILTTIILFISYLFTIIIKKVFQNIKLVL